jgi:hypothetical protein
MPTLNEVLEAGRKDVVDTLRGVPTELAASKPAPDRWSPLECIEHVIVVEHRFLGWIATGSVIAPEENPDKELDLGSKVRNRGVKAQAPEAVVPAGKYNSIEAAIADFNAARDTTARVVEQRGKELYGVGVKHPRFGDMNAAELVHLLTGHACRHAEQIRETVAALKSEG